jgi:tRNA A-37 threonylcarbamoyl transferase component Bud32
MPDPQLDGASGLQRHQRGLTAAAADFARTQPLADGGSTAHGRAAAAMTERSPSPTFPGTAIVARIRDPGTEPRWEVQGLLGVGATAQVFAVVDRNLRREVAVKLFATGDGDDAELERFLSEARIAASLQHPGVVPVHELGADAEGRLFYAMKRVEGRSLAAELDQPGRGRLGVVNALVSVFIDLCSALAYAHHRGIVHQDVKPDNVMLGDFGEVLLVDWGSAAKADADGRVVERHLYGTPLYMSPEQARRDHADARSDVYCLGGTLLHALTGRLPMWRDEPEAFWEAKRRGEIDAPTPAESAAVPRELLAIAMKALEPDPAARYAAAKDMLADLERYQAGLAVSVVRESWFARARRWYRANRRATWVGVAAILAIGGLLTREQMLERASWHVVKPWDSAAQPTQAELAEGWTVRQRSDWFLPAVEAKLDANGPLTVKDGALRLTSGVVADLVPRHPLFGDQRVEWTYRSDHGQDLNCFIGGTHRETAYVFHIGGWGDPGRCVLSRGAVGPVLADRYDALVLQPDHDYRFVMEMDGQRLRLWIDSQPIFDQRDYDDTEGIEHCGFGFEAVGRSHSTIADLVVMHRDLAQKVSPLTVGDELFRARAYEAAAQRYGEFIGANPGDRLAPLAQLRNAQCRARLGEEDADGLLAAFIAAHPEHDSLPVALVERWELARAAHRDDDAKRLLAELELHPGHPILHSVLARMGKDLAEAVRIDPAHRPYGNTFPVGADVIVRDGANAIIAQARRFGLSPANPDFEGLIAITTNLGGHPEWGLPLVPPQSHTAGEMLLTMGRYDEVLARFGRVERLARQSCFASGTHDDEIIAGKWPDRVRVLLQRGDFAALAPLATNDDLRGMVLVCTGRFEEAARDQPAGSPWQCEALYRLGRFAELVDTTNAGWKALGLSRLGRYDEAGAATEDFLTHYHIALDRRAAGQVRESDELIADIGRNSLFALSTEGGVFARYLMPAVLAVTEGREHDLRALLDPVIADRRWTDGQQVWYAARLLTGEIDEAAFREQPARRMLEARLTFLRAAAADCRGDHADAIADYRQFLAMPLWQRHGYLLEETFAELRLRALGADH